MPIASNYTEIAKEIMVVDSSIDKPPYIIERHAKLTNDSPADFYTKLIEALPNNENYKNWVNKKRPQIKIEAACNGKIISINRDAQNNEPYIILDYYLQTNKPLPDSNTPEMEKTYFLITETDYPDLALKNGQKGYSKNGEILERVIWYLAEEFNYHNKENYFVNLKMEVNQEVKKRDIIAIVEDDNPTPEAIALTEIYKVAKKHCEAKIFELVRKENLSNSNRDKVRGSKQETMKKSLHDIWDGNENEWHNFISILKKIYPEDSLPFITEKTKGDYHWTIVGRKPFQKYLAGLIRVCIECKYIDSEYTSGEMASICCNTFKNLRGLERSNFTNLELFSKEDDYQKPFLELIKKK